MFAKLITTVLPFMPPKMIWKFSKQYIAGETVEQAIEVARELNSKGMLTTLDVLGEFITSLEEAEENKNEYLDVIEAVEKAGVKGNYSLKPTSFGLLLDKDIAYQQIREVVQYAASHNSFIRLDMEDSSCTSMEIELFLKLKEEFPLSIGLAIQAYLKRTYQDILDIAQFHSKTAPVNFRLCKGIYVEPESISYKSYTEINANFLTDLKQMFQKGIYAAIATHDINIVEAAYALIHRFEVPKDNYEFQMLYGVTPTLRKSILEKGHKMRVYVPFGKDWFGYSTRRLQENPRMAGVILKALFFKK